MDRRTSVLRIEDVLEPEVVEKLGGGVHKFRVCVRCSGLFMVEVDPDPPFMRECKRCRDE
jgi:hypothetical protein